MGSSYGQFCPVAKALELLDERWTLLIVRELISGSRHFNELRRGVPKMSPTLLSNRLGRLARAGVVERRTEGNRALYFLTPAGRELEPVVRAIGAWGTRWMPEIGAEDLDPHLLMWDMHRNVNHESVPPQRTVVQFSFPDVRPRDWWLVIDPGDVDVCDFDPGHPTAVRVTVDLRLMVLIWRGDLRWSEAVRSGALLVDGPAALRRGISDWFRLSPFAQVPRPEAPGSPGDDRVTAS